jgi:hypothetical protein
MASRAGVEHYLVLQGLFDISFGLGVPYRLVAVQAARGFYGHVLFVHKFFVFGFLELLGSVVASKTVLFFCSAGTQNQGRFEFALLKKGLVCSPSRGLDEIKVAAAAGDLGFFQHLVGDGLVARGLDRLFGQLVAELAFAPAFVELDVGKVAEITGGLGHLEVFLLGVVLVAAGAVELLALDLVFFLQMRLVHVNYLFGELDFFSLELVIRFAVTTGGHAAGIGDPRPRLHRAAAQLKVGEALRRFLGNVFALSLTASNGDLSRLPILSGWVVTLETAVFAVLVFCPSILAFLKHPRVGENVAVAAKQLRLWDIRLGQFVLKPRFLVGPQRREG